MKKLLTLLFCLIAFSAHGQVKISDLPQVSPALGTDLVPMSNTGRSTSSSYVLSVATISAYVLNNPVVSGGAVISAGVATTAVAPLDITQTWNNAAVTFTGIKANVTNTASAAASKLIDLQIGGVTQLSYSATGAAAGFLTLSSVTNPGFGGINVGSALDIGFSGTNKYRFGSGTGDFGANVLQFGATVSAADTALSRVSAGVVGVGTGAAASVAGTLKAATVVVGGSNLTESGSVMYLQPAAQILAVQGSATVGSNGVGDANLIFNSGTNLSRISAGVVGVGTGAAGSTAGALVMNAITIGGAVSMGKTVTAAGTTGARTINLPTGAVNFAAAATSLVVTNNLVSTSSIVLCTVGTNDTTMKSVACVPTANTITITANAAATAETRVYFMVTN